MTMKKSFMALSFALCLLCATTIDAQINENAAKETRLGFSISIPGEAEVLTFSSLEGAPSYWGRNSFGVDFIYQRQINKKLWFESGLVYSLQGITVMPNLPPDEHALQRDVNFSLLTIPLFLKVDLMKFFILNGGLLLTSDLSLSNPLGNSSGIGIGFGAGFQYKFKNDIILFVNPNIKLHAIVPLGMSHDHLLIDTAIKTGISFKL